MLNNVVLIGRMAADPELRKTQTGVSVLSFTLAVQRNFADADGNRATDWIDCVAWRQTADFISRYFKKGNQIAVEGSLMTRTYQDKDGNNRKAVEVQINHAYFVESKNQQGAPAAPATPNIVDFSQNSDKFDDFEDFDFSNSDDLPF